MAKVNLEQRTEQPTAVVHETVRTSELAGFFGRAFGQVSGAIFTQGVAPAGPPFALYFGMPGETVEVEAGFPVSAPISDLGAVRSGRLPGGRVAHTTHVGSYQSMGRTYDELQQWLAGEHLTPHREMWEVYLSDPKAEPDTSKWRTEIYWPVD